MSSVRSNKTIELLIIEDNPADVLLLKEAFRELEANIRIHVAKDGAEGLQMLLDTVEVGRDWRPDIILLDLNLPKISGYDVLLRLKANPRTSCIPILVLTSSWAETDVRLAYEFHANAYLKKPSTLDGILTTAKDIKSFWIDTATLPG